MSHMEDDFDAQIKQEFLTEAMELLEKFESLLLSGQHADSTFVATLFRIAHSLKGAANSVQFTILGGFLHDVENLLSSIRDGVLSFTEEATEILLLSHDRARDLVSRLRQGGDETLEYADIGTRITALLHPAASEKAGVPGPALVVARLAPSTEPAAQSESAVEEGLRASGPDFTLPSLALVVHECEETRAQICSVLIGANILCTESATPAEAMRQISTGLFDVVITGLRFVELSGLDFVTVLKDAVGRVPVLVVWPIVNSGMAMRLIDLRVEGTIELPLVESDLVSKVRTCVNLFRSREAISHLSRYNFNAYIAISRISHVVSRDPALQEVHQDLKGYLDQISRLTQMALSL